MPDPFWNIAHRGACRQAPENSLPAFRLALDQGAHGIELDVRLSADGIAVVHHDADLRRTAGREERISDLSAADLARVDLLPAPGGTAGPPPHIPTLEEAIASLPPDRILDIELKEIGRSDDRLERRVLQAIAGRSGPNWLTSASADMLERLRHLSPEVVLGFIYRDPQGPEPLALSARVGAKLLVARRSVLDAELLRSASRAGVWPLPYTVDAADEVREWARRGAAGIITNRPDVACGALAGGH